MHERARICLFLPSLSAGGAERVFLLLAASFVRQGYGCDLVVAAAGGMWDARVPDGVRFLSLGGGKPRSVLRPLTRYLRRERPDVLMSSVFPANIAALLACVITRTPCVLREANRTADDIRAPTRMGTLANTIAMRLLYPRATAVVALTAGLARHLCAVAGLPPGRVTVIPNPAPLPGPPRLRASGPRPLVLGCGRFVEQKDFALLISAFASIARDRDVELVLIGQGPLKGALQRQAEALGVGDKVAFPGHASDVAAWMRKASVFALSSRWEGFPNVLLEALAAGCPVVATDCSDAVGEILANGTYGAMVPVDDLAAMADGLAAILDGTARSEDPSRHLARYELDSIAMRYLDLLTGIAERSI